MKFVMTTVTIKELEVASNLVMSKCRHLRIYEWDVFIFLGAC